MGWWGAEPEFKAGERRVAEFPAARLDFPISEPGRLYLRTHRVVFVPFRFWPRLLPPADWPIQSLAAVDARRGFWPPAIGTGLRLRLLLQDGTTVWFIVKRPYDVANQLQRLL